jgi:catechol 2,3-dioxygenase-like lactoylglutathione lyase family enzyme
MIGHIGLAVGDLAVAKEYYDRLMPLVGFEEFFSAADQQAYRPAAGKPGTFLFLYPAENATPYFSGTAGLQHLAFMVSTRTRVTEVFELVCSLGSSVVHAPRHFPEYGDNYFAAFWLDLHGFRLEIVCHKDVP